MPLHDLRDPSAEAINPHTSSQTHFRILSFEIKVADQVLGL